MRTIKPPALLPGDCIGVMAPSSYVEKADIEKSKALLEGRGYKVFIHPQTYERHHQSAGTELQKTLAFQGLWQRKDIKAIWAAGGGNRALHFVDSINFEALKNKPKIFIGFSDVTILLNAVYAHTGIITFHGPVFKNLHKHGELDHLLDLLSGEKSLYPLKGSKVLHKGFAEGRLVGGNLTLFQCLPGTVPGKFWKNALLFLEDTNEELSRLDRVLLQLKRMGVFKDIRGLILGDFLLAKDSGRPFGFTLEEIIREHTKDMETPVIMNAPFGHGKTLYTFPIGIRARLDLDKKNLALLENAVKK